MMEGQKVKVKSQGDEMRVTRGPVRGRQGRLLSQLQGHFQQKKFQQQQDLIVYGRKCSKVSRGNVGRVERTGHLDPEKVNLSAVRLEAPPMTALTAIMGALTNVPRACDKAECGARFNTQCSKLNHPMKQPSDGAERAKGHLRIATLRHCVPRHWSWPNRHPVNRVRGSLTCLAIRGTSISPPRPPNIFSLFHSLVEISYAIGFKSSLLAVQLLWSEWWVYSTEFRVMSPSVISTSTYACINNGYMERSSGPWICDQGRHIAVHSRCCYATY